MIIGDEKLLTCEFLPRLWAYTAAVCRNHDLLTFAVGGMEDHMHLLFRLPPTMPLSDAVALFKSNSSKWLGELGKDFCLARRLWSVFREFIQ